MLFRNLCFCILLGLGQLSFGQTTFKGIVADADYRQFLAGAVVRIDSTNYSATTDFGGNFTLHAVPEGSYILSVSAEGYEEQLVPVSAEGKEVLLDTIFLASNAINLKELEVFSSIVRGPEETKIPTAISTVSERDIQERVGSTEFVEILKTTPGIYTSMASGAFGDGRVSVRGFESVNTAVLINGVPVNDMENGIVYWSNWGGLNDVTRYKQVQRGLGASRLAISSLGGTINIITKPTDYKRTIQATYGITNGSYQQFARVMASTGMMKGDWAITVSGARRWGDGFRPGTFTDAWAYFFSAYKGLGKKHSFVLTAFGAPQQRGGAFDATKAEYKEFGAYYNKSWGYQNGVERNRSVNTFHKPQIMLNHYFTISERTSLNNSLYYSMGRGGSTGIQRLEGSESLDLALDQSGQLNWDGLVDQNNANDQTFNSSNAGTVSGDRAQYYIEQRMNNHNWVGFLSTLRHRFNDRFKVMGGIDLRTYRGEHYARVDDLLGADYLVDQDQFMNDGDNNAFVPNRVAFEGDTVRYNYTSRVNWIGFFGQTEYSIGKVDLFGTATYSQTSFYRDGKYKNEFYETTPARSYGKSEEANYGNYTLKGGVNYRFTKRHNAFVNGGYFTRAPFFTNAFVDARVSNEFISNLTSEKVTAIEGGYSFRSTRFNLNLNAYWIERTDYSYTYSFFDNNNNGDLVDYLVNNVDQAHKGIELDMVAKVWKDLELSGMLSLGDWRYKGTANATVRNTNTLGVIDPNQIIYLDGLKVGDAAQTVASLGARYRLPKYAWVGLTFNYFDNIYIAYNVATRNTPNPAPVEKLDGFETLDLFLGKTFNFKTIKSKVRVQANINNIVNTTYLVEGRETLNDPPFENAYSVGRPRTYFISLSYIY